MAVGLPLLVHRLVSQQRLKLLSQHVVHDIPKELMNSSMRKAIKTKAREGLETLVEDSLLTCTTGSEPFRKPVGLLAESSGPNSAELALGLMSSFMSKIFDGVNGRVGVELANVGLVLPIQSGEVLEELLLLDKPERNVESVRSSSWMWVESIRDWEVVREGVSC